MSRQSLNTFKEIQSRAFLRQSLSAKGFRYGFREFAWKMILYSTYSSKNRVFNALMEFTYPPLFAIRQVKVHHRYFYTITSIVFSKSVK